MKKLLTLILCLAFPAGLFAAFEDNETGPRATAMGGAFVAQKGDLSSLYYNPAGLNGIERYELLASYEKLYFGLTDGSQIARNLLVFGTPLRWGGKQHGILGIGWNSLSLDSLYTERKISFGYSYPVKKDLSFGVTLNNLSVSYGTDEYTKQNPVFDSGSSKSTMGFDAGVLKEFSHARLGLSILNLNTPDLGLKYANQVTRRINLGFDVFDEDYCWDGAFVLDDKDYRVKTGLERLVLRSLLRDRVALRGGFSIGSRDYRNFALGFGYRDDGYKVDYSFIYPLSGIAQTFGSHQLALTVLWGALPPKPQDLPQPQQQQQKGKGGDNSIDQKKESQVIADQLTENKDGQDAKRSAEILRESLKLLDKARERMTNGNYGDSLTQLKEAAKMNPNNAEVKELIVKLEPVVEVSSTVVSNSKRDVLLRKGVKKYLNDQDDAVSIVSYATQLWPNDKTVARMREIINKRFAQTAANQRLLPGITIVDQLLQDALDLIRGGRFVQAVATLERALELEPNNVTALTRMGSAYWAMGKKDIARQTWRKVLQIDPNNSEVRSFMNE